jgi:hypothetical protein
MNSASIFKVNLLKNPLPGLPREEVKRKVRAREHATCQSKALFYRQEPYQCLFAARSRTADGTHQTSQRPRTLPARSCELALHY